MASTAQLYLAWSQGLDYCSPGWLSDGSVRYPITSPRDRCGGLQAGVRTLYRFRNQTGFPDPHSPHDVYCFKREYLCFSNYSFNARKTKTVFKCMHKYGIPIFYVLLAIWSTLFRNIRFDLLSADDRNLHIASVGHNATDHENSGQDVVILTETDQELHLNQHAEQVELKAQQVVESFPFYLSSSEEYLVDFQPTLSDPTESYPTSSPAVELLLQQLDATAYPTEMTVDSQHRTALERGTSETTDVHESSQNTLLQPSVYNKTHSHHIFNRTGHESDAERSTNVIQSTYKSDTQEQSIADRNAKEQTEAPQGANDSQEIETIRLNVGGERDSKENEIDHEESLWEANLESEVRVKLEETTVKAPVQMFPSTQASKDDVETITQTAQPTESSRKNQLSRQAPSDGSGDGEGNVLLHIYVHSGPAEKSIL